MAVSMLQAGQAPLGSLYGTVTGITPDGQIFAVEAARLELRGSAPGLPSLATFSDSHGAYRFSPVPPGPYELKATAPGYRPTVKQVKVLPGQAVRQNMRLALAEVRQEIEVHERAPEISQQSTAPPTIISAPRLKTVPTTETRFKEALPFVPSVVQAQNKEIYIKGAAETQGMLLINGLQSVDPVTGSFIIDVPVDTIDSMEVFKAPFLAQYGGFSGGLASTNTKAPATGSSPCTTSIPASAARRGTG